MYKKKKYWSFELKMCTCLWIKTVIKKCKFVKLKVDKYLLIILVI